MGTEGLNRIKKVRAGASWLPNAAVNDTRLSAEARFLLLYLNGCAQGWTFTTANVAKVCCVGRDKLRAMMAELRALGYLDTRPRQGDGGKFQGMDWEVDVEPGAAVQLENRPPENPADGFHPPHKNNNLKPSSKEKDKAPLPPEGEPDLFSADPEKGKDPEPQTKIPDPTPQDPAARFEEFWSAFPTAPRKTDKPKARAVFASIVAGKHKHIAQAPAETIIAGMRAYAALSPDPQFVPLPTTWLNGARWEQFAPQGPGGGEDAREIAISLIIKAIAQRERSGDRQDQMAAAYAAQAAALATAEGWDRAERDAIAAEARRRHGQAHDRAA